jgi:hypothetical protein
MSAGQAVIRKGEQGDTFFILEEGTCTVVGDEGQVRACVCWAMPEHVVAYLRSTTLQGSSRVDRCQCWPTCGRVVLHCCLLGEARLCLPFGCKLGCLRPLSEFVPAWPCVNPQGSGSVVCAGAGQARTHSLLWRKGSVAQRATCRHCDCCLGCVGAGPLAAPSPGARWPP